MPSVNILLGPPGSGKTTLSEQLKEDIEYISVGKLARTEFLSQSELGRVMMGHLEAVQEYPKDVIRQLVESPIVNADKDILLDGFPKYEREVEVLDGIINRNNLTVGNVFEIGVDPEIAWGRVEKRKICLRCDYQSSGHDICPKCSQNLTRRKDDNYPEFLLRFSDYEKNLGILKIRLHKIGFAILSLTNDTDVDISRNYGIIKDVLDNMPG